jgi:NAD(P)-dependent dehydrogenase (short-subunit alcohol dehydrogenase family)
MRSIQKMMNLEGKRALITGANGYIGREIAKTIAELGGDLVLVDTPSSSYDELFKVLEKSFNINIECIDCNLEDEASREELITNISKQAKPLNILINNAAFVGTSDLDGWISNFKDQSIDTWRRALEVNLTSTFHLSKGLSEKIKTSKFGSIINIGSTYGVVGPNYSLYEGTSMGNPAAYAASKGGLIQLSKWLSTTLAPEIRVNSISPGGVFRNQPKSFVEKYENLTPLKRMATEEDFKGSIAYLASELSAYVTGQNIIVDGGWTSW